MRRVIVRYEVKKDRVAEHEALLAAVFVELAQKRPNATRYAAFKEADGVRFVHVAFFDGSNNPLDTIDAFRAFTANIRDRCETPPAAIELETVGSFGF